VPEVARGLVIAFGGTTPATVWLAGGRSIFKSVDGGVTFKETPTTVSLYSLEGSPDLGDTWTRAGTHSVFIGLMWDQGIWRYVEP
jgi:hypothetical protein